MLLTIGYDCSFAQVFKCLFVMRAAFSSAAITSGTMLAPPRLRTSRPLHPVLPHPKSSKSSLAPDSLSMCSAASLLLYPLQAQHYLKPLDQDKVETSVHCAWKFILFFLLGGCFLSRSIKLPQTCSKHTRFRSSGCACPVWSRAN